MYVPIYIKDRDDEGKVVTLLDIATRGTSRNCMLERSYEMYRQDVGNEFEQWTDEELNSLIKNAYILTNETEDNYLVWNAEDYWLLEIPKNSDCKFDIINGTKSFENGRLTLKGKYTDFHKMILNREKEKDKLELAYKKLMDKIKIFGAPFELELTYDNYQYILRAKATEDKINSYDGHTLIFNNGITHIDFYTEYTSKIHKIIFPNTIKEISYLHTRDFLALEEVRFNEGIQYLNGNFLIYSTIDRNIDVYFPKSLIYIQKEILEQFERCNIHLSDETVII